MNAKSDGIPVVGNGFDVHRLVPGRKLILGGIEIPHKYGLLGHSDADVLIHSIMDAILGAVNFPDIGNLFPDSDQSFEGIDSALLLKDVMNHVHSKGWRIVNIDATILAQQPKIAPHIEAMEEKLTEIIKPLKWINVKATTTEKLGFPGREEGIAVYSTATLIPAS